jgi:hypothetical protein
LVWVYLSSCVSFDPNDLDANEVGDEWFVKSRSAVLQQYGIWRVDSVSGDITPHDPLAGEWQSVLAGSCNAEEWGRLIIPTLGPTPTRPPPTPTPVVRNANDAVSVLWSYLVKCFPALSTTDLESTLDPASGKYIVKDKGLAVYGVWGVTPVDGRVTPNNNTARSRDQTVRRAAC